MYGRLVGPQGWSNGIGDLTPTWIHKFSNLLQRSLSAFLGKGIEIVFSFQILNRQCNTKSQSKFACVLGVELAWFTFYYLLYVTVCLKPLSLPYLFSCTWNSELPIVWVIIFNFLKKSLYWYIYIYFFFPPWVEWIFITLNLNFK